LPSSSTELGGELNAAASRETTIRSTRARPKRGSRSRSTSWPICAGADRAKAREAGGGCLALVVAQKRVERGEIDRGGDVDRIQGPQTGLRERPRRPEQTAVEREESDRVQDFSCAIDEDVEWETRVVGNSASYRARTP
jgi:hypothetical protein